MLAPCIPHKDNGVISMNRIHCLKSHLVDLVSNITLGIMKRGTWTWTVFIYQRNYGFLSLPFIKTFACGAVKRSPGRQTQLQAKYVFQKVLMLMFIHIFNKNRPVLRCLFLCPSAFSIIRLEKHYRNEIQFLTPQSPCLCIIVRISFSYHAGESKTLFLKKHTPSASSRNLCLDNGCLILYNRIMSYAVIWTTSFVTTVVYECIKEYLPSIHYEMENPVRNTGSWGLALQCSPLSGFGLKSVK